MSRLEELNELYQPIDISSQGQLRCALRSTYLSQRLWFEVAETHEKNAFSLLFLPQFAKMLIEAALTWRTLTI
jgi:hypothetical protein